MPVGLWLGIGLAFVFGAGSRNWQIGLLLPLALIGLVGVNKLSRWSCLRPAAITCLVFVAVGVALGFLRLAPLKSPELHELIGDQTPGLAQVTVLTDPINLTSPYKFEVAGKRSSVNVRLESFKTVSREVRMRVNGQLIGPEEQVEDLVIGSKLELRTSLRPGRLLRGVGFVMNSRSDLLVTSSAPWWQRVASELRAGLVMSSAHLPSDAAALLPGLTLGDTSVESEDLSESMRAAGLAHLTAVSGANVAIVVGAVLLVTKLFGLPRPVIFACCFLAIGMFAVLVRFEPSVLRASVMAAIALVALVLGRVRLPSAALITAVALLLLVDPWLALSWAFALSVSATAGIIWLSPLVVGALKRRLPGLPRGLPEAFALTFSAQLATAPLTSALGTNSFIVGVPANLLAAPAVPFITIGGLVVTFLTPVSAQLGQLIATLVSAPTQWVGVVARVGANSPVANWPWPSGLAGVVATVTLFLLFALALLAWHRGRKAALSFVGAVGLVAGLVTAILLTKSGGSSLGRPFTSWPPNDWLAVSCDVGQGDALVFKVDERQALVVDVGADPDLIDGCLQRLSIDSVPVVILTHFHSDHAGAIGPVLKRDVQSIGVTALRSPQLVAEMVGAEASRAGADLIELSAGDRFEVGGVGVQVIWPPSPIESALTLSSSPENDASLVLIVRQQFEDELGSFTTLVTGDIEEFAQGALARNWGFGPIDLFKVPHHGSVVQDHRLPGLTGARTAVISVGDDNSFGHPSQKTLDLLEISAMQVFRTDLSGDVAFSYREGAVKVTTRR